MRKAGGKIIIPALFWLAVWALASALVGKELILPSPMAVVRALSALAVTGGFWRAVAMSLVRVLGGVAAAAALGTALGAATYAWRWWDLLASPALRAIRTVPVVSFILLLFFWFPTGWVPPVVAGLMALPVVWRAARQGAEAADLRLLELARHYELSPWRTFRLVRLPAALPALSSGWETGLGLGWKAGMAAEVLCQPKWGLGTQLQVSKSYLDAPGLFAWTAVTVAVSLLTEALLKRLLRQLRGGEG